MTEATTDEFPILMVPVRLRVKISAILPNWICFGRLQTVDFVPTKLWLIFLGNVFSFPKDIDFK